MGSSFLFCLRIDTTNDCQMKRDTFVRTLMKENTSKALDTITRYVKRTKGARAAQGGRENDEKITEKI